MIKIQILVSIKVWEYLSVVPGMPKCLSFQFWPQESAVIIMVMKVKITLYKSLLHYIKMMSKVSSSVDSQVSIKIILDILVTFLGFL